MRNLVFAVVLMIASGGFASEYSPETWFHIIDGNASKEGIAADIQAIAEAGIGGIQFFHGGWGGDVWPGVKEPIPCLSEKWVELVKFTETECHRRGLTFKMQNCPGWSMSGGPWITPDKAMRKLVAFRPEKKPTFDADDDYHEIGTVTFPWGPILEDGGISAVTFPNPQQISHPWAYEPDADLVVYEDEKEVFRRKCPQGAWQDEVGMTFNLPQRIRRIVYGRPTPKIRAEVQSLHYDARALDVRWQAARRLDHWEAKAGWGLRRFEMSTDTTPIRSLGSTKTLVFGHVNAKRRNSPAPKEGTGWECDKMDPRGFEANWDGYLGKLIKAGVKIDGTLVDSWECGCQTWTWKMEEEFEKRCGYKLRPWLPALFGYVLKSEAETEKFLLDWRNTCSRLIEENYYGTIARLARENGMTVQYETAFGDVIPGDILRYWKYADEPMCEFWSPFDNEKGFVGSHDFKAVRPCVSAAHIYGKRRVSAEAFTSFDLTYSETFQELKENANRHFARGVTHLVFHTYTHNPAVTGQTVVASMQGTIGTPFNRIQPWWPYMREFTRYLEYCCSMFETMGHPVVDILWYLGDDVNHKPSERDDLFSNQYKYDYCNSDALMTRVGVKDGRLVFPDGMSYRVLWIPKGTFLLPATEAKLAELEKKGARVIRGELKPDWPPDFEILSGRGDLYWYHRGNGRYFVAARENGFDGKVRMRVPSGARAMPTVATLHLARGASIFLTVDGGMISFDDPVSRKSPHAAMEMVRGMAFETRALKCLNAQLPGRTEDATQKTYAFAFERPEGNAVFLDLGKVCHWATVRVNGKEAERLWCEPYCCDITMFLKDGENAVEVEVTSTLHNTLVREASLPPSERKTWVLGRTKADAPRTDAGLYGPVTLKVMK